MALFLSEQDVKSLLTMPEAISTPEQLFLAQARGEVLNQPRRRLHIPRVRYHTMAAADLSLQTSGQKAYASFSPGTRFLFLLHDINNGDLLSIMEADNLGVAIEDVAVTTLVYQKAVANNIGIPLPM